MPAHRTEPLRLAVITGSTRPVRRCDTVAGWVLDRAADRSDLAVELVDLADFDLPMLDEAHPAIHGRYEQPHTIRWAERIATFDGFVFVTPEYNHAMPGVLKNAIDFLYAEWSDKAAGFVSYGIDAGGSRAVEQLRLVMGEVQVADVRHQVALSVREDFSEADGYAMAAPRPFLHQKLDMMFDQLVAWGGALRALRRETSELETAFAVDAAP